ncbi:dihydroorotate dehydrogenase [Desulfovibrio psychrotolerans]|uniref:Dihydroorotate dehydrogenase n=1 Tax=Desulfovibrio psychrotolerans TaxID=415242 RepID=A0A7J0BU86_9BACT|nr:dihydroorotate dehydrogenase [Desulfovibrio psychrotolerans]GFM36554.1 dihydroorotate dehydrogenase [Desulfovibrio psychrotolerans]
MDMRLNLPGLPDFSFRNPILTASGTFGYGLEFAPYGDLTTLGGIVVKGLSLAPRAGNPMPRIAETPCGMLNAVGLQNSGVESFLRDKLPKLPWRDVPVIANIYACDPAEFAELASILAREQGIAAIEVNISCPNVKEGGILFGQDAQAAARVTEAVKRVAGDKPVIIKLSPNVTDIATIARAVEDAGADMISCINTLSGMGVDIRTRKPLLANIIGGLSGPAIKPVALRCVWQVCRAVTVPVIGIGGITSAEDVLEFMLVGAHAVQVGTANFLRPDFSFRLVNEFTELLNKLGIADLEDYRGSLRT